MRRDRGGIVISAQHSPLPMPKFPRIMDTGNCYSKSKLRPDMKLFKKPYILKNFQHREHKE